MGESWEFMEMKGWNPLRKVVEEEVEGYHEVFKEKGRDRKELPWTIWSVFVENYKLFEIGMGVKR